MAETKKSVKWDISVKDNERASDPKMYYCPYCQFKNDDPSLFCDGVCKVCKKYNMIRYYQNGWMCEHEDCLDPGCMSVRF